MIRPKVRRNRLIFQRVGQRSLYNVMGRIRGFRSPIAEARPATMRCDGPGPFQAAAAIA
jgi:hypothetical protein